MLIYYEIYSQGNLIKRGNDFLDDEINWENELMYVPTTTLRLPISYLEYLSGREEIKIFANGKVFWGIVTGLEENKEDEVLEVDIDHVVSEWNYRKVSVNNAVKDEKVNIIFKGSTIKTKGKINVSATPFSLLVTEVDDITKKKYIRRAGASAWTKDGESLSIDSVDHSKVTKKPGSYDVEFTASDVTVKVTATVKKLDGTESRTKDGVTVSAVPFEMTTDEVSGFTKARYIERANAEAWDDDGKDVTISTVDHSKVKAQVGSYNVSFTAQDATVTVKVKVKAEGSTINTPENPYKNVKTSDASVIDQLEDIYADTNFAYPGWYMNFSDEAADTTIDYVYSRQGKLEALTKTMELTDDLFWRVRFVNQKVIDVSEFGDKQPYIVSKKPSGVNNIQIVGDPTVEPSFENVINVATVYADKSDSGMTSLTLREVYNDESLQKDGFPVVILRANVNNERDYTKYTEQYPKLAPNNELEYAVIDEESVALEGGTLIEGTFNFNDLSPFNTDTDKNGNTREIKDKDRIRAAKTAYRAAIRKLKQARRSQKITVLVGECNLNPGDRVRFIYDNSLYITEACSAYMKKILSYNSWFYITKIETTISVYGAEVNTLTLEKHLHIERDIKNG